MKISEDAICIVGQKGGNGGFSTFFFCQKDKSSPFPLFLVVTWGSENVLIRRHESQLDGRFFAKKAKPERVIEKKGSKNAQGQPVFRFFFQNFWKFTNKAWNLSNPISLILLSGDFFINYGRFGEFFWEKSGFNPWKDACGKFHTRLFDVNFLYFFNYIIILTYKTFTKKIRV